MKIINKARAVYRHLTGKPAYDARFYTAICFEERCDWSSGEAKITHEQAYRRGASHAANAHGATLKKMTSWGVARNI